MAYSISYLKSQRRYAKDRRNTHRDRKKGVQRAYDNRHDMDGYYTDIRYKANDCTSKLFEGIQGISSLEGKCEGIIGKAEDHTLSSDSSFSEAMQLLYREIQRCDEKISSYDGDISWYETQIREQGGHIYPWE